MQLTSCLVNGVDLIGYLLVEPTTIVKETGDRIGTATLEFIGQASMLGPLLVDRASIALWSGGANPLGALPGVFVPGATFPGGGSTENQEFAGEITRVEPSAISLAADGAGMTRFRVACQDLMALLDATTLEEEFLFAADDPKTDAEAIEQVFSTYLPDINLGGIAPQVIALELRAVEGWSVRKFLSEVAARTGATFYMRGAALMYHAPAAIMAAFGIRDFEGEDTAVVAGSGLVGEVLTGEFLPGGPGEPIPVTSALYDGMQYTREATQLANRIICKGKAGSGGVRISSGAVIDQPSIDAYGTKSITLAPDDNIQTVTEAQSRASVELSNRKDPQKSCSFLIRQDGLDTAQMLTMRIPAIQMSAAYFINRMTLSWQKNILTYRVEAGFNRPKNVQDQRRIGQDAQTKQNVIEAIPADATVTDDKVVSISFSKVNDVTITNSMVESIDFTKVENVLIQNSQIGTLQVSSDKISGLEFSKISGVTITNSMIDTVAFSKVTSVSITNSHIVSVDFSKVTSVTITSSMITSLDFAKVTSVSITGSQIASVTITGGNLVPGTLGDNEIGSLSADKITAGTINASIAIGSGGTLTVAGTITSGSGLNLAGGVTALSHSAFLSSVAVGTTLTVGTSISAGSIGAGTITGGFDGSSYAIGGTPGVSGSFTTVDGKTVTVSGGLVTSIV